MKTYTTGQAAKICGLSQTKITELVDSGVLRGYRPPGPRRHRRVYEESLRELLSERQTTGLGQGSPGRITYTTGEVAGMCQVSASTVHRWLERGILKGFHLPESRDWRVPHEELAKFRKGIGMPEGLNTPVYTTGEVAKHCQVSLRTVAKWVDARLVSAYRLPISGRRRIPQASLLRLFKEYNVPVSCPAFLSGEAAPVLLVSHRQDRIHKIMESLRDTHCRIIQAATPYDVACEIVESRPRCLIVDFCVDYQSALLLCRKAGKVSIFRPAYIIGLIPEGCDPPRCSFVTECFGEPFDPDLLAQRMHTILHDCPLALHP